MLDVGLWAITGAVVDGVNLIDPLGAALMINPVLKSAAHDAPRNGCAS
jgi:hypothetical protein